MSRLVVPSTTGAPERILRVLQVAADDPREIFQREALLFPERDRLPKTNKNPEAWAVAWRNTKHKTTQPVMIVSGPEFYGNFSWTEGCIPLNRENGRHTQGTRLTLTTPNPKAKPIREP